MIRVMITSQCSTIIGLVANQPCLIRLYCRLVNSKVMGNSCSSHYLPIPSQLLICQRKFDPLLRESNDARSNKVSDIHPS